AKYRRDIAYAAQEWGKKTSAVSGAEAARALLASLAKRFPDVPEIAGAAKGQSARDVNALVKAGKFEEAVAVAEKAPEAGVSEKDARSLLLYAWDAWAGSRSKAKDFVGATEVYAKALVRLP